MIFTTLAVPKNASRVGRLHANRRIGITVVLAPARTIPDAAILSSKPHSKSRNRRDSPSPYLTHAELWRRHGATVQGKCVVKSFARVFGLEIVEASPYSRNVRLGGRVASFERAFQTGFDEFELDGHRFFAPSTPPAIPADWSGAVEAVLGLQSFPRSRLRRRSLVHGRGTPAPLNLLARSYAFPPGFDGSGETIALIELGGGFRPEDIEQFCSRAGVAMPRITVVEIGSGANRPASRRAVDEFLDVVSGTLALYASAEQNDTFLAAQSTAEVTMDIEIVAALAPGAHIVVYFACEDEVGLFHAISHAVNDRRQRPSILSISWSVPEQEISDSELHAIEGVLREAASLGITVCASSGDNGALNGSVDGKPSVNYPASSPHCLACGGTSRTMEVTETLKEVVWNATHYGIRGASGGGVSRRFPLPVWQADARVPVAPDGKVGRGVPDVAGLADPRYGSELLIGGRVFVSAGTSAVAPLWVALVARLNQALGQRCGHLHTHIYRLGKGPKKALRPVLKGDNGFYKAGKGWNACTGYGTPRGDQLLAYLQNWLQP